MWSGSVVQELYERSGLEWHVVNYQNHFMVLFLLQKQKS